LDYEQACGVDPIHEMTYLFGMVLFPTILARIGLVIWFKEDRISEEKFSKYTFYLSSFWTAAYGLWTIQNFIELLHKNVNCAKNLQNTVIKTVF
jgi:hypothetical protein